MNMKRAKQLGMLLLVVCMILALSFNRDVLAEDKVKPLEGNYMYPHTYPGDIHVDNPFPEIISDQDVDEHIKTVEAKEKLAISDYYLVRYRFTAKDGSQLISPSYISFVPAKDWAKLEVAVVIIPELKGRTSTYNTLYFSWWAGRLSSYVDENGDLQTDKKSKDVDMTVDWNGGLVKFKSDEPIIGWPNPIKERQYLLFSTDEVTEPMLSFFAGGGMKGSSSGNPLVAGTARWRVQSNHAVTTHFHFVDDFAYRKAETIANSVTDLPERNLGRLGYGNKAHRYIDLPELATEKTSSGFFDMNPNDKVYDIKTALLRPEGEPEPFSAGSYVGLSYERNTDPNISALLTEKLRISRADLDQVQVPGYVQVDDDIDTMPEEIVNDANTTVMDKYKNSRGNFFNSATISETGKVLVDKHYYLTYRPLPVAVSFTKTDLKDTNLKLSGAEFSLYRVDNGENKLLKSGLTTVENGLLELGKKLPHDKLVELIKSDVAVKQVEEQGYLSNDAQDIYLLPGSYYLQETKAPQGYKQNKDKIEFKVVTAQNEELEHQTFSVTNEKEEIKPTTVTTTTTTTTTKATTTTATATTTKATTTTATATATKATTTTTTAATTKATTVSKPTTTVTTTAVTKPEVPAPVATTTRNNPPVQVITQSHKNTVGGTTTVVRVTTTSNKSRQQLAKTGENRSMLSVVLLVALASCILVAKRNVLKRQR